MSDEPRAPFDAIDDEELRELIEMGIVEEATKMVDGREQTVYRIAPEYRDAVSDLFD